MTTWAMPSRAHQAISYSVFPRFLWGVVVVLVVFGVVSSNPVLTVASALLLAFFIPLASRPGEPPVLLLALGFQWLQVTMQVHHANIVGVDMHDLPSEYGGESVLATSLSMVALAVLAAGMAVTMPRRRREDMNLARREIASFSVRSLWRLYLVTLLGGAAILTVAWNVPGLTQPALALAGMKWAAFFAFAYVCLSRKEGLLLLLIAFLLECGFALGGYFAEFKTVFFVTLLALIAADTRISGRQAAFAGVLMGLLLLLSVVWTAVKVEYREYVSGGESAQIVVPGYLDRTAKLGEMVWGLSASDLGDGLEKLAYRISYTQFFARTLNNVPSVLPHEDGAILWDAISHVFTPRLFFPDKAPLRDDSEETALYTGLLIAGQDAGTSVSIGYVTQMYVDLGEYLMFVPIFLLGCLWGLIYRFFITRQRIPLTFRYALCVAVMLDVMRFETTLVKLLGGTITAFLVAYLIQRWVLPPLTRRVMRPGVSAYRTPGFGIQP
jgi:hypothetical protein